MSAALPAEDADTATLAALRAKLTGPDPRDGMTAIALHRRTPQVATWATKRDADTALRALRARGLNVDKGIRVQRACYTQPFQSWVITRLGEFGETLLMAKDGSWVAGRLLPQREGERGAVWLPYESAENGETIPATFTHVTRTAPYHARVERYRTKSNGSCGRYIRNDDSVALCTCGWTAHADSRPEAQAAARTHRFEVAA